jgi:hypothetical protein
MFALSDIPDEVAEMLAFKRDVGGTAGDSSSLTAVLLSLLAAVGIHLDAADGLGRAGSCGTRSRR